MRVVVFGGKWKRLVVGQMCNFEETVKGLKPLLTFVMESCFVEESIEGE